MLLADDKLDAVFHQLKDSHEDYDKVGTICEQVTKLELEKEYTSPQYEVKTGVIYRNKQTILGELDAVVFKKDTQKAILAAEVKCWRDQDKALKKAKKQLLNFFNQLNLETALDFFLSTDSRTHFQKSQFEKGMILIPVSYRGSGFKYSLEFSLSELLELRERILNYQSEQPFKKVKLN
jgi:hypothetical protein